MADIELHRVHGLGLKAARAAADRMAGQLARKFDLKGAWEGNVLRFQRPGVSGSLTVTDKDLSLSVTLGLLLKAMQSSIQRSVEQELDSLFRAPSPPRRAPSKARQARPPKASPRKGR